MQNKEQKKEILNEDKQDNKDNVLRSNGKVDGMPSRFRMNGKETMTSFERVGDTLCRVLLEELGSTAKAIDVSIEHGNNEEKKENLTKDG